MSLGKRDDLVSKWIYVNPLIKTELGQRIVGHTDQGNSTPGCFR